MVEAFPWETAPRYLLRDRDAIYGERFRRRVRSLLIKEVITAPQRILRRYFTIGGEPTSV